MQRKHLLIKIKSIKNIIVYYILLGLGLISASWIIYSRFLRERTIRNIPDTLLTEYRVWFLTYLCCIYAYTVKNLIKPGETNIIIAEFIEYVYKPLVTLDSAIKYNKFIINYFYEFADNIIGFLYEKKDKHYHAIIICSQILPRLILIAFLSVDTFYFSKIEIFYKVILLGVLPFVYRYFKYSLKDLQEYYTTLLENKYEYVHIYEKDYIKFDWIQDPKAIHHDKEVSIREYIEIKFRNTLENLFDYEISFEYTGKVYARNEIYEQYCLNKYNIKKRILKLKEYDEIHRDYHIFMPKILRLKYIIYSIKAIESWSPFIKYSKIFIFSTYLICWGYILIVSYYNKPIELIMFKYLLANFMTYLQMPNEIFNEAEIYSMNTNMITEGSTKYIYNQMKVFIVNKIDQIFG